MARLETHWASGGVNMAIQYVLDMTPKRVRAYICTATNELVIRPRMTSQHLDTLVVRGIPNLNDAWAAVLQTNIPKEYVYIISHVEWSEDRATMRTSSPPGV